MGYGLVGKRPEIVSGLPHGLEASPHGDALLHRTRCRMTITDAIRKLRVHFRLKYHPHDCICACCEAIEVLELATREAT